MSTKNSLAPQHRTLQANLGDDNVNLQEALKWINPCTEISSVKAVLDSSTLPLPQSIHPREHPQSFPQQRWQQALCPQQLQNGGGISQPGLICYFRRGISKNHQPRTESEVKHKQRGTSTAGLYDHPALEEPYRTGQAARPDEEKKCFIENFETNWPVLTLHQLLLSEEL